MTDILKDNDPYTTEPVRWYQSYPYGFSFSSSKSPETKLSETLQTFWLPIAPNNLNITTHFATNIITTLYGIVEEHSEVRYYDITISGNTGIAPKYTVSFNGGTGSPSKSRSSFGSSNGAGGLLGGFLPEVTNTVDAAINLVNEIAGGSQNETGIKPEQSGYYAFHNFYKFLLRYKQDTAGTFNNAVGVKGIATPAPGLRTTHPLQFLNYKDNVKYDVIPISFTLTRSAEHPMLYNYSIRLRGFNLQNVNSKTSAENLLSDLGLGNLKGSLFSKMTSKVGNASTLISGITGAF